MIRPSTLGWFAGALIAVTISVLLTPGLIWSAVIGFACGTLGYFIGKAVER